MRKVEKWNHMVDCENCKWCSLIGHFPYCVLHNRDMGLFQVCDDFERYKEGTFVFNFENSKTNTNLS